MFEVTVDRGFWSFQTGRARLAALFRAGILVFDPARVCVAFVRGGGWGPLGFPAAWARGLDFKFMVQGEDHPNVSLRPRRVWESANSYAALSLHAP